MRGVDDMGAGGDFERSIGPTGIEFVAFLDAVV